MTTPNAPTAGAERCPLRHPGMDVQCGLAKGHRGEHTTEIPNTMPWATHGDGVKTSAPKEPELEQWFRDLEDDNWGDAVQAIRAALLAARREVERMQSALREIERITSKSPHPHCLQAVTIARAALAATPEEK